jgi:hypothetical protein
MNVIGYESWTTRDKLTLVQIFKNPDTGLTVRVVVSHRESILDTWEPINTLERND